MRFYTKTGKYLTIDYQHLTYSKSYNQFKVSIHIQAQKITERQYKKICTNLRKTEFHETN